MPPVKAVIFDLDGTITEPFFDFDAIRREIGLAEESGPILEQMENMPQPMRRRAEKILFRHEQRAIACSRLNPGARETIERLSAASIRIGVLTRNTRKNALAVAAKHGLSFHAVCGREDGPVKPDAYGVLRLCDQLGVSPGQTVVVGDFLFDLLSARRAGAVAVLLTNTPKSLEFASEADFTVEKIDQILQIIDDNRHMARDGGC